MRLDRKTKRQGSAAKEQLDTGTSDLLENFVVLGDMGYILLSYFETHHFCTGCS